MNRRHFCALACAATLAGCASPNPTLYTLAPSPGPVVRTGVRSVELHRIALAGYLDRPEIVRSAPEYRLRTADTERWGEALGRMMERVLVENLAQRLPSTAIYAESGAITATPDIILEINVQRFDADPSNTVVLLAQVSTRRETGRANATTRTVRLTATPATTSTPDLVATMSDLLGQFADAVAGMIGR